MIGPAPSKTTGHTGRSALIRTTLSLEPDCEWDSTIGSQMDNAPNCKTMISSVFNRTNGGRTLAKYTPILLQPSIVERWCRLKSNKTRVSEVTFAKLSRLGLSPWILATAFGAVDAGSTLPIDPSYHTEHQPLIRQSGASRVTVSSGSAPGGNKACDCDWRHMYATSTDPQYRTDKTRC